MNAIDIQRLSIIYNMNPFSRMDKENQAPLTENFPMKEAEFSFTTSSSPSIISEKPAKKPTRQWAAWTRQEEENFFNALRQVGKNFERITCRVQSKNKDQVRHYYYRLVRRINKLLGPGFCLDAKNSKDTIAAMLRWWSLLEKFSCTASKLHLKPRRFKIFVEALENQLLKDRNKSRRKRPQGDIYLASPSSPISNNGPGNDSCPIKLVVVDGQNNNKIIATKGTFFKRHMDANSNFKVGAAKGDLSIARTVKQKRRAGIIPSAVYKKWEKAAIAGVTLVADAAEQLEKATMNQSYPCNEKPSTAIPNEMSTFNGNCCYNNKEADLQPFMKLKLQLFPINEATRMALEKAAYNPHLELTLSARKRITSVLEHLNRKWGNSSIASGELMLFPYSAHQEDLVRCQRWTMKDTVAAADVFASVGSPGIFRLRYGWFSMSELESGIAAVCSAACKLDNHISTDFNRMRCSVIDDLATNKIDPLAGDPPSEQPPECPQDRSTLMREKTEGAKGNQNDNMAYLGEQCATASAGEWADSLTDISIGYLLAEASRAANCECIDSPVELEGIPHSHDSFDAVVAEHVSCCQSTTAPSTQISHSSIWGAEETCDAFSFSTAPVPKEKGLKPSAGNLIENNSEDPCTSSLGFQGFLQDFAGPHAPDDYCFEDMKSEPEQSKDFISTDNPPNYHYLSDICWLDSLGPLDLETPSFRFQAQDVVLGDSLGSLSRMMASSLDAFRNLSFFGMDNKDP